MTPRDVVDEVRGVLAEADRPSDGSMDALLNELDRFDHALEEEWDSAGRGGFQDEAENRFMDVLKAYIHKSSGDEVKYMPGEPIKVQQEKIKERMDESAAEFEKTLGPVEKQIYDVLPIPKDAAENYRLKNSRNPASGRRLNTRVFFEHDNIYYVVGDKTPVDGIKLVQKVLSTVEIQEARKCYPDIRRALEI